MGKQYKFTINSIGRKNVEHTYLEMLGKTISCGDILYTPTDLLKTYALVYKGEIKGYRFVFDDGIYDLSSDKLKLFNYEIDTKNRLNLIFHNGDLITREELKLKSGIKDDNSNFITCVELLLRLSSGTRVSDKFNYQDVLRIAKAFNIEKIIEPWPEQSFEPYIKSGLVLKFMRQLVKDYVKRKGVM